jgi:oligosaccharide repeat unit polymerase
MRLLWLYLGAFLLLPIIGEFVIYLTGLEISAGRVTFDLILNNIIFVIVLIVTVLFISNYKIGRHYIKKVYAYKDTNKIIVKIIILLFFIVLFIFIVSGYKFLFLSEARGDIRISLGFIGPFYTLFLNYIPVLLVTYATILYTYSDKKSKLYKKIIIVFLLLILIGIFSGYKAVAISLMIPGFVVLYFNNFNIKRMFILILFSLILLILFTALVRKMPIIESFSFLIYRLTTMTAYGTVGVWNEFNHAISLNDLLINSASLLGNKMASYILAISQHDIEFLKTSLSRLVTYLVYPDTEGALNGTVNVTVTNFGDAIYLFGKKLYIFYALFVGFIIGITIRYFKIYMQKQLPLKTSMMSVYFFSVIIPSINSGGIFGLFSLVVIINLIITYIIGRYIIQKKITFTIKKET